MAALTDKSAGASAGPPPGVDVLALSRVVGRSQPSRHGLRFIYLLSIWWVGVWREQLGHGQVQCSGSSGHNRQGGRGRQERFCMRLEEEQQQNQEQMKQH